MEHLDVYINNCGSFQQLAYDYIMDNIKEKNSKKKDGLLSFENMDSFGYTILQKPLQALNMVYPNKILKSDNKIFDSKILLGSEGLKRCMKFKETTNPPTKKNFEYKNNDFGDFFAPENIGQYSSKIKSIIDNIYNSDGIVLIYSQFIDGGVIPMALALESMGFTRFGNKASNLFKTPPRSVIDYKTLVPKNEMADSSEFKPATYTLLTGEKALSPDKIFDLKNLTDEDNKNGEKIKVIIISMTGSEGLDFKNLRQVHIMEPWYNLSLIEQIIGRAVRNCSHKQLAFINRNVEIFLYGTLLHNSEEEAVDLYIYRLAELKAVQIGRVSRILKESSVDCLLNMDQTLFTEDNMNTVVKQQLSNKMTIDYPIGDKSKTVSCDYMDTCDFKCKPFKQITEEDIKLDTYNEAFILINTDKIIQRIRDLFKQKFFYKKDRLISEINVEKNYPLVQVNVALTSLINDKNDYLVDKYDRLGHLINIEEYYLFQPIELNNENISIFDRNRPIDYKAPKITVPIHRIDSSINIKQNIKKNIELQENRGIGNEVKIMNQITESYNIGQRHITEYNRGEDNWYVYLAVLHTNKYLENTIGINDKDYDQFLIEHILEKISFNDTYELLNYIYFKKSLSDIEQKIKKYYDSKILSNKGVKGIILSKKNISLKRNTQFLLVLSKTSWIDGKQEDYTDLAPALKVLIIPLSSYNINIGFMGPFKDEDINIFKVKNMADKRSKGARCDQSGKSDTIKLLNTIIGKDKNDKYIFNDDNIKGKNKIEFCVLQEMYLRYFNKIGKNNKRWFLSPEESIINDLEKIHF